MNIVELVNYAQNKANFSSLNGYIDFSARYLEFVIDGLQAKIISQREENYCFFQYQKDGNFNISRPLNLNLLYEYNEFDFIQVMFKSVLQKIKRAENIGDEDRIILQKTIYTLQQSIGATLDALPSGKSNTARKINGDLFERLIRIIFNEIGVDCRSGIIKVPVKIDGVDEFSMSYQHDLLIFKEDQLKVIGSVKTSSKDRIDKIFIDKLLYSKLTETNTPHIAVFLNDVQRKRTRNENQYGINQTFLPGHFKGYSIKLCPLDGVYYCDILPSMVSDKYLHQMIKPIDQLFCDDLSGLVNKNNLQ